jgi:hypothetical protein
VEVVAGLSFPAETVLHGFPRFSPVIARKTVGFQRFSSGKRRESG